MARSVCDRTPIARAACPLHGKNLDCFAPLAMTAGAAVERRRSNERCGQSLEIMVCNASKEDQAGDSMSTKASLKLDTAGRITSRHRFHLLKAYQQKRARLQAGLSFSD